MGKWEGVIRDWEDKDRKYDDKEVYENESRYNSIKEECKDETFGAWLEEINFSMEDKSSESSSGSDDNEINDELNSKESNNIAALEDKIGLDAEEMSSLLKKSRRVIRICATLEQTQDN